MLPPEERPILGRDDPTIDARVDTMTEEALLRGLREPEAGRSIGKE